MAFILEWIGELTAESVLSFVGTTAAQAGVSFFTNKALQKAFPDEKPQDQQDKILQKLKDVHEGFQEINAEIKKIAEEIGLDHWDTRIFEAEIDIRHKFELLLKIIPLKDRLERHTEAERLKAGILDTNTGILKHLTAVHHVLVGRTTANPTEKGLLEMMITKFKQGIKDEGKCRDHIINYANKTAVLQFKAIILFLEASESTEFCKEQFSLMAERIKEQIDITNRCLKDNK